MAAVAVLCLCLWAALLRAGIEAACASAPDALGHLIISAAVPDAAYADCKQLRSLYIAASVTALGGRAFDECTSLTHVTFAPDSLLATIGPGAFHGATSLLAFEVPPLVQVLSDNVFMGATLLSSVTFAQGTQLQTIGHDSFSYSGLQELVVPASVRYIRPYAFVMCGAISFAPGSGLEAIEHNTFTQTSLGYFKVPAAVTSIASRAFLDSRGLRNVTFKAGCANTVTIGANAFQGTAVTQIELPWSATCELGCGGVSVVPLPACPPPPPTTAPSVGAATSAQHSDAESLGVGAVAALLAAVVILVATAVTYLRRKSAATATAIAAASATSATPATVTNPVQTEMGAGAE